MVHAINHVYVINYEGKDLYMTFRRKSAALLALKRLRQAGNCAPAEVVKYTLNALREKYQPEQPGHCGQ